VPIPKEVNELIECFERNKEEYQSGRCVELSAQSAKTDQDKIIFQRQIDATDNEIDQLVYQLYGLADEQINIVEEKC